MADHMIRGVTVRTAADRVDGHAARPSRADDRDPAREQDPARDAAAVRREGDWADLVPDPRTAEQDFTSEASRVRW